MTPFKFFITEDRAEVIRNKYKPVLTKLFDDEEVFDTPEHINRWINHIDNVLASADPTANKIYLQWLYNIFISATKIDPLVHTIEFFEEDHLEIRADLVTFDRVKARMPVNLRDINKYKTYRELRAAVTPYIEAKSNRQEDADYVKKLYDNKQITLVYKGSEGKVEIPHSIEASKYLGRGTRWCTAAETNNYFNHYDSKGPLFVYTFADGKKWQFHFQSDSFMDAQDSPIAVKDTPNSLVKASAPNVLDHLEIRADNILRIYNRLQYMSKDMKAMIVGNAQLAHGFAYNQDKPFPEGEAAIAKDPIVTYEYARLVLHKRFIKGEPSLFTQRGIGYALIPYTLDVIRGRWDKAEKVLLSDKSNISSIISYSNTIMNKYWPEAEAYLSQYPGYLETYKEHLSKLRY